MMNDEKGVYIVSFSDIDIDLINYKFTKEEVEEFTIDIDNETYIYTKMIAYALSHYSCSRNIYNEDGTYKTVTSFITEKEYQEKLLQSKDKPIDEVRYHFIEDGIRYRLIIYLVNNEPFAILECDSINKKLPRFIRRATNVNLEQITNVNSKKKS